MTARGGCSMADAVQKAKDSGSRSREWDSGTARFPFRPMVLTPPHVNRGSTSRHFHAPGSPFDLSKLSAIAHDLLMTLIAGAGTPRRSTANEAIMSSQTFYRSGAAVAVIASFVQIWMNLAVGVVGESDNPVNQGFFGVVVTAAACSYVARLHPDGMVRAMLAVSGVQAMLALAVATAPSTAQDPMGPAGVLTLSGIFVALWLVSAALFHRSAQLEAVTR